MKKETIKVCTHCVMDTTDTNLVFDENGVCDRCNEFEKQVLPWWNHGYGHEEELKQLINDIKKSGEGKEYDCLLGLSGGLDSSYMAHLAIKEWGLRPFIFHVDTGWDLPVTIENLKKMEKGMGVKFHNYKMDWEEMRQMQIAFFKAGFAGLDVPQDHAFVALVDYYAEKYNLKYILNGFNIATEAVSDPSSWFVGCGQTADKRYVKDVLKKNGCPLPKHYVWTSGFRHKVILPYIKGIKTVQPLNLVPLTRKKMLDTMHEVYDYESYGQKHFEDEITKFIEGYWNVKRFGYDVRIAWLSSLVMTGEMTREEALNELKNPPIPEKEAKQMFKDIAKKLQISEQELEHYLEMPFVPRKYKSYAWAFNIGIKLFQALGLDHRIRK